MIDRAYAHYRWADRYRRRNNRVKSKKHLDRGDYYARCWALRTRPSFGVDEDDKLGTELLVLKHIEQIGEKRGPIGEIGQIDPKGKLAWFLKASKLDREPIDELLSSEYRGTATGRNKGVYRSIVTGAVYIIDHETPDIQKKIKEVEYALNLAFRDGSGDPRDIVLSHGLRIAEDWRDGMLLAQDASGRRDTTMAERYAYYHYLLNKTKGEVKYANKAYIDELADEAKKEVVEIPAYFFKKQNPSFTDIVASYIPFSGTKPFALTIDRGLKSYEMKCRLEHIGPKAENVRIMLATYTIGPESLIPDSRWSNAEMTKYRARMILGVNLANTTFDNVNDQLQSEAAKLVELVQPTNEDQLPKVRFEPNQLRDRCAVLTKAARTLHPDGRFFECNTESLVRYNIQPSAP
jgi:hypothetical protein